MQPVLSVKGVSKSFPGVKALHGVDFTLLPGEVHALVGENGAGKSTLMKILAGVYTPGEGEILFQGQPVRIRSPKEARQLGISIVYQELNLSPNLSVAANIFLGQLPRQALSLVDRKTLREKVRELLAGFDLDIDPDLSVAELTVGKQQMVEIMKALSFSARVVIMDEPTAALTETETQHLLAIIRRLRAQGVSIIYISHRLDEIFQICDRVTTLRDGVIVGCHRIEELDKEKLVRLMVGRDLEHFYPHGDKKQGKEILRVEKLTSRGKFQDVSFTLHEGEILGLAGLMGAGRTEVARALFGADPVDSGRINLEGRPVEIHSPGDAIRLGIGLVPEDRKAQGLVLGMTVRENATLTVLRNLARAGWIKRGQQKEQADSMVKNLRVKTPSLEQTVLNLSGGNQQKVVLAKWLATKPRVLILDEPTRGIDVGAKEEIHALIGSLAEQGMGVIVISSELPEVLGVSHRILVLYEGRFTGEFERSEATEEKINYCAHGGAAG